MTQNPLFFNKLGHLDLHKYSKGLSSKKSYFTDNDNELESSKEILCRSAHSKHPLHQ